MVTDGLYDCFHHQVFPAQYFEDLPKLVVANFLRKGDRIRLSKKQKSIANMLNDRGQIEIAQLNKVSTQLHSPPRPQQSLA